MKNVKELFLAQDHHPPVNTNAKDSRTESKFFDNSSEWLTTREAAIFLRISAKALLNLCSQGKIPHYKFGRSNRYRKSELEKVLLAQPRGGLYGLP
jgi:excisionase family DNA binding protein